MRWKNLGNKIDAEKLTKWIILINVVILLSYLIKLDIYSVFIQSLLIILISICLISLIFSKVSIFQNIQITLFVFISILMICEAIPYNILPLSLRNYLVSNKATTSDKVVEFLQESPYAKFKPGVVVRSKGDRGSDFVYEWKTDRLGFKNLDSILADKKPIQIVVVGDSFAEGMGVATEDTFSSLLTKAGYLTYNLGVQGYAPKQMEGSFRLYGYNLRPKYVVIAYCSGTYRREYTFFDEKAVLKERKLTGGIAGIERMENNEIRVKTRHVTTTIYLLMKQLYWFIRYDIPYYTWNYQYIKYRLSDDYLLGNYSFEIALVEKLNRNLRDVRISPEWQSLIKSFANIKGMSDQIGSKVIIMIIPQRGPMYYQKAMAKQLNKENILNIEKSLLRDFCKKNNIEFCDASERIQRYLEKLNYKQKELFPYLEIDGHLNKYGHQLICEEIKSKLTTQGQEPGKE